MEQFDNIGGLTYELLKHHQCEFVKQICKIDLLISQTACNF